ncbi:MAG: hypothetical protein IPI65_17775 [Bacteroidetes bacterium]|nr:hypothetical protein [Bacteroidota bacterium]
MRAGGIKGLRLLEIRRRKMDSLIPISPGDEHSIHGNDVRALEFGTKMVTYGLAAPMVVVELLL